MPLLTLINITCGEKGSYTKPSKSSPSRIYSNHPRYTDSNDCPSVCCLEKNKKKWKMKIDEYSCPYVA